MSGIENLENQEDTVDEKLMQELSISDSSAVISPDNRKPPINKELPKLTSTL